MMRTKLGDEDFFRGMHYYLETNRGQNVVTADLEKAIDHSTSTNVDQFFHQWVWRAGAPKYEVSYTYDDSAHQIKLNVKQTQKVEGMVDLFDMPVEVEIATAAGHKTSTIQVSKAEEIFTLPADSLAANGAVRQGRQHSEISRIQKRRPRADLSVEKCRDRAGPRGRRRGP